MLVRGLVLLAAAASASASASTSRTPTPRTYDTHTYYALEHEGTEASAAAAAQALGAELVEPLGELEGHWLARRAGLAKRSGEDPVVARWKAMRSHSSRSLTPRGGVVRDVLPLEPRQRVKRVMPPSISRLRQDTPEADLFPGQGKAELEIMQGALQMHDPILDHQWHLANVEHPEWELNVTKLWQAGIDGRGVHVAVVDDGLDMEHEDLKDNYFADGSWDFNDNRPRPEPTLADDQHGTRCAGEIAAASNDACGVGVAHKTNIAGLRILSGRITDADEAAALNYKYQVNDIYSCSWGPPDDGMSMEGPEGLILKAMVNGVQKGRGGKGSLFVFAAGNGAGSGDQCNFDGYTNSIFTVTVGAVDHVGNHPYYSEQCAAMMIVAPSSGSREFIHTTDVGKGKCAHNHGGTSAAAPLAAGVLALLLQKRPELSWRDVQHLIINNAVKINPQDTWETTAAGRPYSYKFGYGKLDAGKLVEAADAWTLVKPQAWFDSPQVKLPYDVAPPLPPPGTPDSGSNSDNDGSVTNRAETIGEILAGVQAADGGDGDVSAGEVAPAPPVAKEGSFITTFGVKSTFEVTQKLIEAENLEKLEHVTVRVWIEHMRRGAVEVSLKSPNGIESVLALPRPRDSATTGYDGWKFMSLKHWGENPIGTWTLTVRDTGNPREQGRFKAWSLQLWGECIDPNRAQIWSPAELGGPDEEVAGSANFTAAQKPKPTDLLPSDHGEAGAVPTDPVLAGNPSAVPSPSPTPANDAAVDVGVFDGMETLRSHSAWLAGAFFIVLVAMLAGGGFFLYRQRQRRRTLGMADRGAYAPVGEEEVPLSTMRRPEESKELYDAFGDGPSDSEDEEDEAALRYHDRFLDDDEEPVASGSGSGSHDEPPAYRASGERRGESNSSGSWQDAGEDVPR